MSDKISEEQCVQMGGHCYVKENYTLTSNPPQYDRTCKHCGKRQRGTSQPDMSWRDLA